MVSVSRVTNLEKETIEVKQRQEEFIKAIASRLGNDAFNDGGNTKLVDQCEEINHDPDFQEEFNKVWIVENTNEANNQFSPKAFDDACLNMELTLPHEESQSWARATKRLRDANKLSIGKTDQNHLLDTRIYEVECLDGHKTCLSSNSIVENMFSQVDDEGEQVSTTL